MERLVTDALLAAGDTAGASTWRQVCRELSQEPSLAVASRDPALAARVAEILPGRAFPVVVPPGDPLPLGVADRILGARALVWATPITAPLGAEERSLLSALAPLSPGHRGVFLGDRALLDRLSDDPEGEARDVHDRVKALMPDPWPLVDALAPFVADAPPAQDRRAEVARVLLGDAVHRASDTLERLADELARVGALESAEAEALDAARQDAARLTAHLSSALRRQTEGLVRDLRDFLLGLEGALPEQVAAVPDLDTARRALPHWLGHVVEGWVSDRLALWSRGVRDELDGLRVPPEALARTDLLMPALHPPPLRDETGWNHRLAVSAALGGGAALLVFGQWIPGVLAVGGGLSLSAFGREAREAASRDQLVAAAVSAVRALSEDAERRLGDQLDGVRADLDALFAARDREHTAQRDAARERLAARRHLIEARFDEQERIRAHLQATLAATETA